MLYVASNHTYIGFPMQLVPSFQVPLHNKNVFWMIKTKNIKLEILVHTNIFVFWPSYKNSHVVEMHTNIYHTYWMWKSNFGTNKLKIMAYKVYISK
jgi:hypothetical protein